MKQTTKPITFKGIVEDTPFRDEGWEVSATPQDGTSETVLPISARDAIAQAEQGDSRAWGLLYSYASFYIKQGIPIPEPLGAIVSKRLSDLSRALVNPPKNDIRAEVLNAVAPMPDKKKRLLGAKKKILTVDAVAVDVLRYAQAGVFTEKGMSLKAASRKVAAMMKSSNITPRYSALSLEAAAKRVRKQQQDAIDLQKTGGE